MQFGTAWQLSIFLLTIGDRASCVGIGSSSCLLGGLLCSVRFVPLFGDLFFPVGRLSDLIDAVLDDRQGLPDLVVLHILLIVKLVCKFEQVIDLGLFVLLSLLFSHGPSRLLRAFFALFSRP